MTDHLPPGTVSLIEFEAAHESSKVVPIPQPSNDPNEPLNWSMKRKAWHMLLIVTMTIMAFTLVTYQTIFWEPLTVDLNTNFDVLGYGSSAQLAGLAVGCFFFIPFAVKYGRRPVYILSMAVMAGGSWWTSRMQNSTEMILSNLLTGIGGAVNETLVQMTIADLFFVHQRARANSIYFMAVIIGSFVTPLPAGAHAAIQGWRWSYYALSISLTGLTFVFIFGLEETKYVRPEINNGRPGPSHVAGEYPSPQILNEVTTDKNDTKAQGPILETFKSNIEGAVLPTPNNYMERMRLFTPTNESIWKVLIAPLHVIFLPHVLFCAIQFSFGVAWLVILVVMNTIFFSSPPYNFTTAGVGYMNVGPFIGSIFGSLYGGILSDWSVKRFAMRNGGVFEPEMRLYIAVPPCLLISGGLAMYGVTASMGIHWIYPSIGGAMFAAGLNAMGDVVFTFVIDTYKEVVAEAFVGISFIRNLAGIVLLLVRPPWAKAVGFQNQFITISCISFFITLLCIPMIVWGKKMRAALAPRYYAAVEKCAAKY